MPLSTIQERAHLLLNHAKELLNSGALPGDLVDIREHRFPAISEGYFLLNRAYKDWRMPDGHFTERPKIAALQAVVISRYQPFFPKQVPIDEANVAVIKCNEIFALSYALGILEIAFTPNTDQKVDFWLRLLDVITDANIQTIEAFTVDRSLGIIRPLTDYDRSVRQIHPNDKPTISALISIFELMSTKGVGLLDKA